MESSLVVGDEEAVERHVIIYAEGVPVGIGVILLLLLQLTL